MKFIKEEACWGTRDLTFLSFFCSVLEIEAKEACDWLRATGFPQYAQLYEGEPECHLFLISIIISLVPDCYWFIIYFKLFYYLFTHFSDLKKQRSKHLRPLPPKTGSRISIITYPCGLPFGPSVTPLPIQSHHLKTSLSLSLHFPTIHFINLLFFIKRVLCSM